MSTGHAISYVEVHLTNRCNVVPPCFYCTYSEVNRDFTLPLDSVVNFLQITNPSVLMLVGGGEPTFYHHNGKDFREAVKSIRDVTEETNIRVVTNGISIKQLVKAPVDSVGISLGGSYYFGASLGRPKRGKLYRSVLKNLSLLLSDSLIPQISVSFVYHKENLDDLLVIAQDLFDHIGEFPNLSEKKFYFFSLACADDNASDVYHESNLTQVQSDRYREQIDALMQSGSSDFRRFIESHTKIDAPLTRKKTSKETHCGMAANYVLVAADGNLYPCCVAAAKGEAILGSIDMNADELYARRKSFWEHAPAEFCQWCRIKNTYMGKRAWSKWQ